MEYTEILDEINRIYSNDFDMTAFNKLGSINTRINEIASKQDMKNPEKKYNYHATKSYFDEMVFNSLKEKLGYEDEVIYKIMKYINIAEIIKEIYVIDGNIIVKAINKSFDGKFSWTYYIPEQGFYDIASFAFNDDIYNEYGGMIKQLILNGISNTLKSNLEIDKPLMFNKGGGIEYNQDDIRIFINKRVSELSKINESNGNEIIKVLVKDSLDEIYSFDMKLRGGYLVIYQNEYPVNKVSEELDSNKKSKAKIKKEMDRI